MACTDSPSSILLPTFGDAPPMVIECGCGEVYQADDHDVGGWLRCRCGRIVHVRRSEGRQSERAAMISRPRGRWSWQRSGTGKHPGVSQPTARRHHVFETEGEEKLRRAGECVGLLRPRFRSANREHEESHRSAAVCAADGEGLFITRFEDSGCVQAVRGELVSGRRH